MQSPSPPSPAAGPRRGFTTVLFVVVVALLLMGWAFAHHFTVLSVAGRVRASQAARRATLVASNFAEQAPQLLQLALNGETPLEIEETDEGKGLPGALHGLGMNQVLRASIPPPDAVIEAFGSKVRVTEIEGAARFLEVDGVDKPPDAETCDEFSEWRIRWNRKGG